MFESKERGAVMKKIRKGISVLLSLVMVVTALCCTTVKANAESKSVTSTKSMDYMKALGNGWNLGNTFDSYDTNLNVEDLRENTWGNPDVTKELIHAIKEKGFDSIRIPMTTYRRCEKVNGTYVIDEAWLARYKEVVDWAVEEGLYVMINMHHDSSWLSNWDGNKSSEEYLRYTDCWTEIADCFKNEPQQVCFETINEPQFNKASQSNTVYNMLDTINLAAYSIIRKSGGNNGERMIVLPTYNTNQNAESLDDLYDLIKALGDENIIATIHYYSEWCFSGNLGTTGFDDPVNGGETTSRDAVSTTFKTVYDKFIANGIGVVVGEYGLLGTNEVGEYVKYLECVNAIAHQYGMSMMFWDAGNYINRRDTVNYSWNEPRLGEIVYASMKGRSSTATCLDELYFSAETEQDVEIPLRINGPKFTRIKGLTEGADYTYDESESVITLHKSYINRKFVTMDSNDFGVFDELLIQFASGADWHEYLCKNTTATVEAAQGTVSGITIPVSYNGSKVRRVSAYQRSGSVGPTHSWCKYLTFAGDFKPDYENDSLTFYSSFLNDSSLSDGPLLADVEMWDGQVLQIWLNKTGSRIECSTQYKENIEAVIASPEQIVIYTGENAIPNQYLNLPDGGSVYGTWITDSSVIQMDGWPATMTFSNTPTDFTIGGIVVYYYDVMKYVNGQFAVKAKPELEDISLDVGDSTAVTVKNLDQTAVVNYDLAENSIASISNGMLTGYKTGTTTLTATVTQFGRTDKFVSRVKISGTEASETPEPSQIQEPSVTPRPSAEENPAVSVKTTVSGQVTQSYTVSAGTVKDFDLSKLTIRYYYSCNSQKEQNFWIDNAGISLDSDPYYINYTSNVVYHITQDYVELEFAKEQKLSDGILTIQARMNHSDWSPCTDFKSGEVKVFYDGKAVFIK